MADEPQGGTAPVDAPPAPPAGDTPPAPSGDAPPPGGGTNDQPPAGDPPAPVVYDLKLPEGSTLDAALLERTVAVARDRGLSPEQAQAAVDLLATELETRESELLAAHAPGGAAWAKQDAEWKAAALADAEIGGSPEKLAKSVALANRVIDTYGDDAAREFLEASGLGSHPAALKFLARLGRAMGEGTFVQAGGGPAPDSKEAGLRALYPSMFGT